MPIPLLAAAGAAAPLFGSTATATLATMAPTALTTAGLGSLGTGAGLGAGAFAASATGGISLASAGGLMGFLANADTALRWVGGLGRIAGQIREGDWEGAADNGAELAGTLHAKLKNEKKVRDDELAQRRQEQEQSVALGTNAGSAAFGLVG
jgi:hypothetical protein